MNAMNRKIVRWIWKKTAEALGEEEVESLKKDLLDPVKKATAEALEDMLREPKEK